jgi:hypothetical protein
MDSLPVSRRDFCCSALVASSLAAAGLPARALAVGERTPANVRVSHDVPYDHAEPSLAVNPRDPRQLLAVGHLENPGNGASPPATYSSFDGGRTWRGNGPMALPAGYIDGGNNTVGFDGEGRGFVCSLLLQLTPPKNVAFSVAVWRTDDGGRTFSPAVLVSGSGVGQFDHPWLAAEHRPPHAVHVVWTEGPQPAQGAQPVLTTLKCARSTDGGRTFDAARTIASDTHGLGDAMIACGPPRHVYVIYHTRSNPPAVTSGLEGPGTVIVLRSEDHGRTFDRPIELGRTTFDISFPNTDSNTLPAIAADPDSGLVCAAFTRREVGAPLADILLAASRDGGRTWSRAKTVTPQDQIIYFEPQVAIDAAGRIGVMAYAWAHGKISVVLMLSEPRSLRFGPPITITNHPFDPTKSEFGARWYIGSYQALATTPGAFHPLWTDTRTGHMQLFTATVRVGR